jgi:DNA-binding helix-hairpin-helix protein with protein kinase domain
MSLIVRNRAGENVQLADTPIAQGGEAAVYGVPDHPGAVVKLYHPHVLQKRGETLPAKIEAMCTDPRLAQFKQDKKLAWPIFPVWDAEGRWRGYAMRKVGGERMTVLAHAMAYRAKFPHLDRPALAGYLLDLVRTLQRLHDAGVMVGDYNLANFLCDPQGQTLALIDCDSWQVQAAGKTFRCAVAAPDMLAPELQGKELSKLNRTLPSEYFSLAILIFKTLMLGRHPYDVVGGAGPVENIRKGYFPYGVGAGGIPKGSWYNIWSHLPYALKELFIHTFNEGAQNPAQRASLKDWANMLAVYLREMKRGWHSTEIKPATPKSKAYRGTQSISQPCVN